MLRGAQRHCNFDDPHSSELEEKSGKGKIANPHRCNFATQI
jgi:hypothetical protein